MVLIFRASAFSENGLDRNAKSVRCRSPWTSESGVYMDTNRTFISGRLVASIAPVRPLAGIGENLDPASFLK